MAMMSSKSLEKAIKSLLRTKYEVSGHRLVEYFEDIMPIMMPKPGSIHASWNSKDYAEKLCRDYFNW